jgi:hypothetical protein
VRRDQALSQQFWHAAIARGNGKYAQDLKRDAMAEWHKFVSCVSALPPDQAALLWQAVIAEASPLSCSHRRITYPIN